MSNLSNKLNLMRLEAVDDCSQFRRGAIAALELLKEDVRERAEMRDDRCVSIEYLNKIIAELLE